MTTFLANIAYMTWEVKSVVNIDSQQGDTIVVQKKAASRRINLFEVSRNT